MQPITIVGSGLAGYTLARELRQRDPDRPLRLVSADGAEFYSKPMLSNAQSQGKTPEALTGAPAAAMAQRLKLEILPRTRIEEIDARERCVITGDGARLPYGALVLALGAEPLRPALSGDAADAVLSINDLDDYRRWRAALAGRRVVILGGGLIGCEFANDLAASGFAVQVVDRAATPLGRLVPPELGSGLRAALERLGVTWHPGRQALAVRHAGAAIALTLDDGSVLHADAVLSAIGLRPRTALAQAAGLRVNRGIVVDRLLRSSDPAIHALGDCAEVEGLLLPFVQPIMHAARALAATLSGEPAPLVYPAMPVVVKTPAWPVVVAPPPAEVAGQWSVQAAEDGVRALFHDADGRLRGFALGGGATREKTVLAQRLPPLLA